jgi:hypothetical protein
MGHPPVQKTKKLPMFSNPVFSKRMGHPQEKCHYLLGMDFLVKDITSFISNLT